MKNRKHLSSAEMKKVAKHFKKEVRKEQEEPKPEFSKGGHVKKHEHKKATHRNQCR